MASRREIEAGKAVVTLSLKDGLEKGLRQAQNRLRSFGAVMTKIGAGLTAVGAAITGPLTLATKSFISTGDALQKLSQRVGVSTAALSELGFAAEQNDASLEDLGQGLAKMAKALQDAERGSQIQAQAFERLGLSVEVLKQLRPEDQFAIIADRIKSLQNPTERTATLLDIFGQSGLKLGPLLLQGSRGIAELREQASKLGLSVKDADADLAALLGDTLNELWRSIKAAAFAIGKALAPSIIEATRRLSDMAVSAGRFIRENRELIVKLAKIGAVAVAAGASITALGVSFTTAAAAIGGIITTFTLITNALPLVTTLTGTLTKAVYGLANAYVFLNSVTVGSFFTKLLAGLPLATSGTLKLGAIFQWTKKVVASLVGVLKAAVLPASIVIAKITAIAVAVGSFAYVTYQVIRFGKSWGDASLEVTKFLGAITGITWASKKLGLIDEKLAGINKSFGAVNDSAEALAENLKRVQSAQSRAEKVSALRERLDLLKQRLDIEKQLLSVREEAASKAGLSPDVAKVFYRGIEQQIQKVEDSLQRLQSTSPPDLAGAAPTLPDEPEITGVNKAYEYAREVFKSTRTPLESYRHELQLLGAVYRDGMIDADTYRRAVQNATAELGETDSLDDLNNRITELNTAFLDGLIPIQDYQRAFAQLKGLYNDTERAAVDAALESIKTPIERYHELTEQYRGWLERGLIDAEQFNKLNEALKNPNDIAIGNVAGRAFGTFSALQAKAFGSGGRSKAEGFLQSLDRKADQIVEQFRRLNATQGATA